MNIPIIGALLSALGFGSANVAIKKLLGNTSIPQTLFMSFLAGTICLFLLVVIRGLPLSFDSSTIVIFILLAIAEVGLYLILYKAFDVADVTVASAVVSTYPIFSTIITVLFFNERFTPLKIVAIIFIVLGAIVTSIDFEKVRKSGLSMKSFEKGLPWALLCLAFHAVYFPLLGRFAAEGSWETKLLGIKLVGTLILFIFFIIIKRIKFEGGRSRLGLGFMLGFLEVVGWSGIALASSLSEGMIALIIVIGSSAPIATAVLARIFLKERLSLLQYVGVLIIVISLAIIALPQ